MGEIRQEVITNQMKIRSYRELSRMSTFEERYEYLRLVGVVGQTTFGSDRFLNQGFYRSKEWRQVRDKIIVRDGGCDLGIPGYDLHYRIVIHHMNPIKPEDIESGNRIIFDPEFLIVTSEATHQAIHFGDSSILSKPLIERHFGDTNLW